MSARRPTSARAPLTRERVLAAALNLIDERGLERFTMRALGADLGVEAMSIYKHLPGKDAVLDGVVELLLREFEETWQAGERPDDWRAHLSEFAHTFRALAAAHPRAFPLLSRRSLRAYVVGRSLAERALTILMVAGLPEDEAIAVLRLVVRFTLGFALSAPGEASVDREFTHELTESFPHVSALSVAVGDPQDEHRLFSRGVDLLLDGVAVRLAAGAVRG